MPHYDLIIVGTGFASSFFLSAYLEQAPAHARVLVLERGRVDSHTWQVQARQTSSTNAAALYVKQNPEKNWYMTVGFGGGSNCWWACTPRFMPNDFRMRSMYGVGADWPMSYDDLAPFYDKVEAVMSMSGPAETPFPRSGPYPQPPHRFSDPDKLLKAAYPDQFFHQPTARARIPTANRGMCCANGVCTVCPVNAKFTIQNEMQHIYRDERVTLRTNANVIGVETQGGQASGAVYELEGQTITDRGDLVVLGANALFNPYILLRSGLDDGVVGKGINEQVAVMVVVDLDGVDNFQGSTSITGHGYMLYDGPHRAEQGGILIETYNIPTLRTEAGKWRQRMALKCIVEDLPQPTNYVAISDDESKPEIVYQGHSAYTQRAIDGLPESIEKVLAPLPVERFEVAAKPGTTEAHVLCTTPMGDDPATSVVDRYLRHHRVPNLVVLGSGAFPTGSPANPTLTLSALSLWSVHGLFGNAPAARRST